MLPQPPPATPSDPSSGIIASHRTLLYRASVNHMPVPVPTSVSYTFHSFLPFPSPSPEPNLNRERTIVTARDRETVRDTDRDIGERRITLTRLHQAYHTITLFLQNSWTLPPRECAIGISGPSVLTASRATYRHPSEGANTPRRIYRERSAADRIASLWIDIVAYRGASRHINRQHSTDLRPLYLGRRSLVVE